MPEALRLREDCEVVNARQRRPLLDKRGRHVSQKFVEAIHEAGHAAAAMELGIRVFSATLVDVFGDGAGGSVATSHPDWLIAYLTRRRTLRVQRDPRRRGTVERYLIQCIAGRVAERILLRGGRPPHHFFAGAGSASDASQAIVLARLLGARGRKIRPVIRSYESQARDLLERSWSGVEALARKMLAAFDALRD